MSNEPAIELKDVIRGNNGELFMAGYKGKGMCSHCICSYSKTIANGRTFLVCQHYQSLCKLVSRNCLGIRMLKPKNEKQ